MSCSKDFHIEITSGLSPNLWWPLNEAADPRVDSIQGATLSSINATVIGSGPGKVDNASQHSAANIFDPAALYSGNIAPLAYTGTGFDAFGWVKFVTIGTQLCQVNYQKPSSQNIFSLQFQPASNQVELLCVGDALNDDLLYPQVITAGTWYFWRVYYDPVSQKFGMQIGDSVTLGATLESIAIPFSALASGSLALTVALSPGDACMFDETGFFFQKLTDAQAVTVWDAGVGRTFP